MHNFIYISPSFLQFLFIDKSPFYATLPLQWPVPHTTAWPKYLWICVLLSCFLLSMLIAEFCHISFAACIWMFLSALLQVRELGPLPLDVLAWAMNDLNSWTCISIEDMSSQAASNNHNCVQHLSIALPLWPMWYSSNWNVWRQEMWYFLTSYHTTHQEITGNR